MRDACQHPFINVEGSEVIRSLYRIIDIIFFTEPVVYPARYIFC